MILLSTLVSTFAPELHRQGGLLPGHVRALNAMAACRTAASAVMLAKCPECNARERIPHSCGHRLCSHCQHHEGQQWLERQRSKLLPVEYYLVTFTLPQQLRGLVWHHQRIGYDLLIKLGWQTLLSFGLNDDKLQGKMGAHAVLHTHSRRLDYHPHVHFIVPAGALDPKHRLWRKKQGKYLFNQGNLAKVFRAKWFAAMTDLGLSVGETIPKDWVVDCKHVGGGNHALTYLGKYLYRGVLQEKDILRCEDGLVTFRYTENTGTVKTRTLPGVQFLRLLLRHVLPKGFHRTRDFGFLHSNCKALIRLLHWVFRYTPRPPAAAPPRPPIPCKCCGGVMEIIATRLQPRRVLKERPA